MNARAAAALTGLIARVAAPLAVLAADGALVLAANEAGRRLFAVPGGTAPPWRLDGLVGAFAARSLAMHLRADPVGGPDDWLTLRCETAAGLRRIAVSLRRSGDQWLATLEDRTPATAAAAAEQLSWRENLAAIANWLPVGIEIYDGRLHELFANTQSHRVFDYGRAYFGRHDDWWELGFPDPEARAAALADWTGKVAEARRRPGTVQESEWLVRCSDGLDRTMQFRYRFLGDFYVVTFWDVSEQRQLEAELRRLAGTDALTGLPNRRSLLEAAAEVSARQREPLALLMLDLDHFKSINDRFGHAVGDRALQVTAERCRQVLRDSDVFARVGGEEFAVLLPGTGLEEARLVADRLHGVIRESPYRLGDLALEVRASVGGALTPVEAGADTLLDRADRALYVAKSTGRDRVVFAGAAT